MIRIGAMPRTIEVTELILTDAQQSLAATRMALDDTIPVCEDIDKAGFGGVQCWGGATFDAGIRFLNEDPGDLLFVLESMKMETEDTARVGGKVAEVKRSIGDSVKSGPVVWTWA
jgi:pyruvate/oxaloacetate carboxyltransferase